MNVLMLTLSLWITLALKVFAYIYFVLLCIMYLIFSLPLFGCKSYSEKNYYCFLLTLFLVYALGLIILSINIDYYRTYLKQCPYLLNRLYYNMNLERRCEIFKISRNSRYAFQYICSYDSSKEFKYKLEKKIKENTVICVPFKNSIPNNHIISLYIKEYINYDNYYCFRTNRPKNYAYVEPKNCNNKSKFNATIAFYVLFLIQFIAFCPTYYINGNAINAFENFKFYKYERNLNRIEQEKEKKKKIDEIRDQLNNIRNMISSSTRELFSNNKNKSNISEQKANEKNVENHESSDNKENNENHDNNNENIEKNKKVNNIENNNIENIEKNGNNNNDKNDDKTSINIVVKDKNILSAEKDNKKINLSKENKLSPTNSIHLNQIECGFAINSEADIINKNNNN